LFGNLNFFRAQRSAKSHPVNSPGLSEHFEIRADPMLERRFLAQWIQGSRPRTMILSISVSHVTRITGMSPQCPPLSLNFFYMIFTKVRIRRKSTWPF
jgi:hypothetical protein